MRGREVRLKKSLCGEKEGKIEADKETENESESESTSLMGLVGGKKRRSSFEIRRGQKSSKQISRQLVGVAYLSNHPTKAKG